MNCSHIRVGHLSKEHHVGPRELQVVWTEPDTEGDPRDATVADPFDHRTPALASCPHGIHTAVRSIATDGLGRL